ncbi:hypothetical protein QFC20_006677 [Naganishia adeliensis]|uniref:Uncharacterized protein n=1 Tax=Naganishia adeliensis TaxID=92952 RepID=A0ACC2V7R8_9TREE|nr:hypothetical protein QFC20_006677 [Naganishia adeliensis]
MENRKHQCLLALNKQSVDRLALATVEDNNKDIARTICAMIFLPAVADSSLLPPYWMNLEEPWYRLDGGGSDELCETCQQQNVTSAIEFLDHLERQGEDREGWAPTVALMIGACQAVQTRNDMIHTIAGELTMTVVRQRTWWKVYEEYWGKGYSRQMERCKAATCGRELPAWEGVVKDNAAVEEGSGKSLASKISSRTKRTFHSLTAKVSRTARSDSHRYTQLSATSNDQDSDPGLSILLNSPDIPSFQSFTFHSAAS